MSLLEFEGFDWMASLSAQLLQKTGWSSTGTVSGFGRGASLNSFGGVSATVFNNTGSFIYTPGGNHTTFIVGKRFNCSAPTGITLFLLVDTATTQVGVSVSAGNKIIVWRGTTANVLVTGTTTIVANATYYVEVKATFNAVTGYAELRVGGVTEGTPFNGNTLATANAFANNVWALTGVSVQTVLYDDFYLCNDVGSAPQNNFLGVIAVETTFPTANNSVTFIPNASTNVSRIQETATDGDTTYNASAVSGDIDTFTHGALQSTPVTIFGVQPTLVYRKDDVTVQNARTKLLSGVATQNGATFVANTIYQVANDIYITDPATSSAWSATAVNNSKIGYEHV